jgi:hypothetical protein
LNSNIKNEIHYLTPSSFLRPPLFGSAAFNESIYFQVRNNNNNNIDSRYAPDSSFCSIHSSPQHTYPYSPRGVYTLT